MAEDCKQNTLHARTSRNRFRRLQECMTNAHSLRLEATACKHARVSEALGVGAEAVERNPPGRTSMTSANYTAMVLLPKDRCLGMPSRTSAAT